MSIATLPEGDWIRGISIRQPYAACILAGAKTVSYVVRRMSRL